MINNVNKLTTYGAVPINSSIQTSLKNKCNLPYISYEKFKNKINPQNPDMQYKPSDVKQVFVAVQGNPYVFWGAKWNWLISDIH